MRQSWDNLIKFTRNSVINFFSSLKDNVTSSQKFCKMFISPLQYIYFRIIENFLITLFSTSWISTSQRMNPLFFPSIVPFIETLLREKAFSPLINPTIDKA